MRCCELHNCRGVINLVSYYRTPTAQADSLQSLYSAVAAANSFSPVIICGDFDVPDMNCVTTSPSYNSCY